MLSVNIQEWLPQKIVSGGQSGADRAALDGALRHNIPHGGWCPKGRLATDGPLAPIYKLQETESAGYRQRTKRNVVDSEATLIFNIGEIDGGTLATVRFAESFKKPHLVIQLDNMSTDEASLQVVNWLRQRKFCTLNVAGPREEKRPGIYSKMTDALEYCLSIRHC